MPESYIPSKDSSALDWMQAFRDGIAQSPSLYMLSEADSEAISEAVDDFQAKMAYIVKPINRNKVTVAAKDDARTSAEQICRHFAQQIKLNSGISDPAKIAIGVRPINPNRDPIPTPVSSPLLSIFAAGYATQTIKYVNGETGDKAKPYGVRQLQLWVAVGDEPATNPAQASLHGIFTKSPIGVAYDPDKVGKRATYWARWCTVNGKVGPWSAPVNMSIAA